MGNRAVITTKQGDSKTKLGIYLHWNGGRDSVRAFLRYAKMRGFRPPETDNYGWARLAQIISNYFGKDGLSIGVDIVDRLDCDNWDNGVYLIENWEIVGRENFTGVEQDNYPLEGMLFEIDASQPADQRLGEERIKEILRSDNGTTNGENS